MSTSYDEIIDLALVSIRDYWIDKLYNDSPTDFNSYMDGFLIRGLALFSNCTKDLSDRDDNTRTFNVTLNDLEKRILADIVVLEWLNKNINDVTQMNLHLNDTDFKHYSEAQNLKEKVAYRSVIREEIDNLITKYNLQNVPWTDWASGNYGS